MIGALTNHLWQSTAFALAAGLMTLALRKNRAQVRYWLWFSASLKFFVPFSLLLSLGSSVPVAKKLAAPPAVSLAMEQIAQPFEQSAPRAPSTPSPRDWKPVALLLSWACGFASIAMIRFRGWLRIRAALRASTPVNIPAPVEVRASPGLLEPGVVGFLRPILLLPQRIEERLTPPQLEAVLAHELCHVRRRDNLFAGVHMLVEATFWFHPLIWWIGARLVEERERACDEAVLSQGSEPRNYAEGILNVCKLYVESPLTCVSGVTGSDLKKRIQAIMTKRVAHDLNFARKLALAVAAIAALAAPIAVGILNAPAIRAQSAPDAPPKFEVAAIRQCKSDDTPERRGGDGVVSPGRLSVGCTSVERLIWQAYVAFADNRFNAFAPDTPISGAPAWAKSDRYQIDAKAEAPQSRATLNGSMLRALLEDRFKLSLHRETRKIPVYALTVAKSGPKLQPFKEGSCLTLDFSDSDHPPITPRPEPGQPLPLICGTGRFTNNGYDLPGMTMATFRRDISFELDRPVIDRTGIAGMFTVHLDLSPADLGRPDPDSNDPAAPPTPTDRLAAVSSAINKLGLKLESSKGPGEFLVIDHVERPSEN